MVAKKEEDVHVLNLAHIKFSDSLPYKYIRYADKVDVGRQNVGIFKKDERFLAYTQDFC